MKIKILFIIFLCMDIYPVLAENGNTRISWETSIEVGIEKAIKEQKLLFLDFYADWCPPCKKMDIVTYTDERVSYYLNRYVPVRIDIDKEPSVANEYDGNARKYGGSGVPAIIIMDAKGNNLVKLHGFLSPDKLVGIFEKIERKSSKY